MSGVRTVAQDLTVKILTDPTRSDSDIAAAIQNVLTWDVAVPKTVTARYRRAWSRSKGRSPGTISVTLPSARFGISRALSRFIIPLPSSPLAAQNLRGSTGSVSKMRSPARRLRGFDRT